MKVAIGDIFESGAQTLINTVNCVGVMGKGIAAEFKKRFPDMFENYVARCDNKQVKPGVPYLYRGSLFEPLIINFPTKSHWRAASRINDIEKGLRIISEKYKEWGVESIAIPPLGCGNGQLLWEAVGPMIYRYASQWKIPVIIYAPYGTHPDQLNMKWLADGNGVSKVCSGEKILKKLNPAWIALIEIVYRIEKQKYHLPVGRTIFQKIAYVATVLGLPTELKHVRGSYGPYCADLNEVKSRLANSGLMNESKLGNMFHITSGPMYKETRIEYVHDIREWDNWIDKTVDLFSRLDTDSAELVASVLFVEKELKKRSKSFFEKDILDEVMKWKQKRRPPLNEHDVAETIRNLGILKWIDAKPTVGLLGKEF